MTWEAVITDASKRTAHKMSGYKGLNSLEVENFKPRFATTQVTLPTTNQQGG